ncbi:MAG: hypothetical protein QF864_01980 [SAR202 cluster bacterium]|nr:hypothetical protein [SAR202 cluster bacterium]
MTPRKLIKWNEEIFMMINIVVSVTVKTSNKKRKDNYDRSISTCMDSDLVR